MKTPKELREEAAGRIASADAITASATERKEELTEDENAAINAALTEAEALQAEATKLEASAATEARLAAAKANLAKGVGRISTPAQPDGLEADHISGITKDMREDHERGGFETFGEFALAVKAAEMPGHRVVDERLGIMAAALGQNTFSGEDGGFLVGTTDSNAMFERAADYLDIISKCDIVTIGGDANSIELTASVDHDASSTTYRYGGIVVYYVEEAGQYTRSSLKVRKIRLDLHKLTALAYCTEEMLSDANINFGARLLNKMGEAIGDQVTEDLMFGNGTGRPLGAFVAPCCLSVAKETGQDAATIVTQNIVKMQSRLWAASMGKSYWYHNQECLPQLDTLSLAVGTGGIPTYWPVGGLAANTPATIKGRPAYSTDHCEALGTAGDIVVGDWSQYLFASKGTVKTAMSIHLRFDYDEVAYKASFRVDGRPIWEQALTPRKGTATVSPFVKIAVRA